MFQNKLFFKEHMTNRHVTTVTKVIARIKPCRYFQYGSGCCSPRSGECRYDHTVVPDNERELCFHKEACKFKPHCIYFHLEGQENSSWEEVRRSSKICRYTVNGQTFWRSVCSYVHPTRGNNFGFHWDRFTRPPITPVRASVIVRNNFLSKKEYPDLNQSLIGMTLNT